jgi:putative methionine-R-sulfoxide reductase with GAF domain
MSQTYYKTVKDRTRKQIHAEQIQSMAHYAQNVKAHLDHTSSLLQKQVAKGKLQLAVIIGLALSWVGFAIYRLLS